MNSDCKVDAELCMRRCMKITKEKYQKAGYFLGLQTVILETGDVHLNIVSVTTMSECCAMSALHYCNVVSDLIA